MPFPRTIRRSTSLGSVLPVLLLPLVILSLFIANLNLIFIMFQNANKADDRHEPRVIEETSMKGVMQQNEILQFNLNRCRARKPKEFDVTATFLQKGNMKSPPMLNVSTRPGGSMRNHQVVRHLANKPADSRDDETQTTLINRELFNYMANKLIDTRYPGVEYYTQYAVARLGLLPSTHIDPLVPGFGTVINDVLSFRYPLAIAPCSKRNSDRTKSVFIAVVSACDNLQKRNTIRQTWKQHFKAAKDEGLLEIAGFAFILGLPDNNAMQQQIKEESQAHADIIQIAISDNYKNLPMKDAGLLSWLHANCADVMDFVAKVDDDVYVNVRNLASFVHSHHQSNKSIYGVGKPRTGWPDRGTLVSRLFLIGQSLFAWTFFVVEKKKKDGKWAITYEEWPWKEYPPYMLGAIVLISADAILPLLAACQTTPMIHLEDVYLYGICANKAGIRIRYATNPNR